MVWQKPKQRSTTAYPEYPAEVMILTSRVDEAIESALPMLKDQEEKFDN